MRRWPYTFAVALSVAVAIATFASLQYLAVAQGQKISFKDPEGFLGPAYVRLPAMALLFFAVGIVPAALKRYGFRRFGHGVVEIIKDEWTLRRVGYIITGLATFYVCYVCYRNLKSYLPLLRTNDDGTPLRYDTELLRMDHWMLFGNNPGTVLHDLLGTGWAAHVLAFLYVLYLILIPVTLGAFLVLHKDPTVGAWYATALGLNWVLGTVSYYILPTLGPAFAQPQTYAGLPVTGAAELQNSLNRNGWFFTEDPSGNAIYGIAGFASLHVSVVFTACLFFERVGMNRVIRVVTWAYLVCTILATIYFGWHYIADDIAGLLIGWAAVSIGAWATSNRGRRRRRHLHPPADGQLTAGDSGSSGGALSSTA